MIPMKLLELTTREASDVITRFKSPVVLVQGAML